jgi:hypothetical protein
VIGDATDDNADDLLIRNDGASRSLLLGDDDERMNIRNNINIMFVMIVCTYVVTSYFRVDRSMVEVLNVVCTLEILTLQIIFFNRNH